MLKCPKVSEKAVEAGNLVDKIVEEATYDATNGHSGSMCCKFSVFNTFRTGVTWDYEYF